MDVDALYRIAEEVVIDEKYISDLKKRLESAEKKIEEKERIIRSAEFLNRAYNI